MMSAPCKNVLALLSLTASCDLDGPAAEHPTRAYSAALTGRARLCRSVLIRTSSLRHIIYHLTELLTVQTLKSSSKHLHISGSQCCDVLDADIDKLGNLVSCTAAFWHYCLRTRSCFPRLYFLCEQCTCAETLLHMELNPFMNNCSLSLRPNSTNRESPGEGPVGIEQQPDGSGTPVSGHLLSLSLLGFVRESASTQSTEGAVVLKAFSARSRWQ